MKVKLLRLIIDAMKLFFIGVFAQVLFLGLLIADNSKAQKYQSVKEVYISLEVKDMPLTQLFRVLEEITGFHFTFNESQINKNKSQISIHSAKQTLEDVLLHISKEANLQFKQVNNNINVNNKEGNSKKPEVEIFYRALRLPAR